MSAVMNQDNAVRTAPHNEVEAQLSPDNGQRDDAEATAPEEAQTRQLGQGRGDVPDGFYWGKTAAGAAIIKPTERLITELAAQFAEVYEDTDEREHQLKTDKTLVNRLSKAIISAKRKTKYKTVMDLAQQIDNDEPADFDRQLDGVLARLETLDAGWLGQSLIRGIGMTAQQDAANNLSWAMLHHERYLSASNAGNEGFAEQALINFETSRTQMLVAMQVLDWAVDNGFKLEYARGARDALGLRGWSLTQNQQQNRAAARQNTKQALFGQAPATPEEAYEEQDAE